MLIKSDSGHTDDSFFGLPQLQERVALLFTLLAAILMIFLAISDFFLGLNSFLVLLKLGLAIPFLAGYFMVRKRVYYQPVLNVLLVIAHVGIFFNYVNNDGFRGPTIYTYFILIVVFAVLLRGWAKPAWFVGSLIAYGTVFYLEVQGYITVVRNYADIPSLYLDHLITIFWCSSFIFIGLNLFISRYKKQTEQLEDLSQRQTESLMQIQQVNEEKNRLLALLAHDLKNPIGTLSTTLSLVDEGFFDKKDLDKILLNLRDQSYHLNKVLNNTLSYVMTELEIETQKIEEADLVKFTDELKRAMQVQADQKKQIIEFEVKGQTRVLPLEINEISIILKNLLDNAIKFSDIGAHVFLTLEILPNLIRWRVVNEGVEIPKKERDEIFVFQAKTSYGTTQEKGTGLGLPLSKKIADANGFNLGFESSSFKTVFFLEKNI